MINKAFQKYLRNTSGNIATTFALLAFPMVVLVGGGIDVQRVSQSKVKLQSAVEASTLAAASFKNRGKSTKKFVREYILANLSDSSYLTDIKVDILKEEIAFNKREITVETEAVIKSSFLQLLGRDSSKITASSTAIEARGSLEYSMVLDISSSMRGAKLSSLKDAAKEFVDLVLDDQLAVTTSVNLIPFGGSVNLGTLYDSHVADISDSIVDPSKAEYSKRADIPNYKYRFTDGEKCVELQKGDYDLDLIPAKSRAQIPHFWKYAYFNPWCPKSTSAAVWNSNNATVLKARVDEMTLSDGTAMNHGALWGAKSLSPSYRGKLGGDFPDRPVNFDDNSAKKVIIIMSDGAITGQNRPLDYKGYNVHTNQFYGSKSPLPGERIRGRGNNKNQQLVLKNGNNSDSPLSDTAVGNFKKTCEDLKSKGVNIYTVGFKIAKDSKQEALLEYCASNPANYYLVESLDISEAFKSIVASVNQLRVSG